MQTKRILSISEVLAILLFASVPLFITFPFRPNIFLSWEGAYRMSNGQIPFRDFGIPMGGMYWAIPALFFKIFGSQMITLVKAQAFINIISGLAFRSVLKTLNVNEGIRFASVLLYCGSYSFINFWPWYNHTVMVYGFIALSFVLKVIMRNEEKNKIALSLLGALFTFFSFFTKQDGGGLIFLVCSILLLYYSWLEKKWKYLFMYSGGTIFLVLIAVLIFSRYDFSYWFNHGQPPHNARVSGADIANVFFGESQWLKFYFFVVIFVSVPALTRFKALLQKKQDMIFLLVTLGILCLSVIFQVTSYTPAAGNAFMHSFAFAYIFSMVCTYFPKPVNAFKIGLVSGLGVMLWWSSLYWNYMQRIFKNTTPKGSITLSAQGENIVNMHNAWLAAKDSVAETQGGWVSSNLKTLRKMTIPKPTEEGMARLLNMDIVKQKKDIKVLNMSELTFLAKEMPFTLERGPQYPLWYHLGVGMFNREAEMFDKRIRENYYDLVLFEYIPTLNNFYPFRTHESLLTNYRKVDSFPAPRTENLGTVEIYIKK